ncbi:acyltransferase family protein [Bacteroidota bacterium]
MKSERRYDIDWIRILAFDLLIIYHIGMIFNTWDSQIKNNITIDWLEYPMAFLSLWRLPLLFVVSGMGTRFALSYRTGGQYIKERFIRLFVPLLVGILVIVPPQLYVERVADGDFSGNFWNFYPHFFEPVYPKGNLSWQHLWFLPYLLVMSIFATPLFLKLRRDKNVFSQWLQKRLTQSPYYLYLFIMPLLVVEVTMEPIFPVTRALIGDWYALVYYFLLFVSGFVLITLGQLFWKAIDKIRTIALLTGIVSFQIFWWLWSTSDMHILISICKTITMWSTILAIFAYGARYLNKASRILSYRSEAVYPFYIIHYTIILLLGFWLMNDPMPVFLKFVIIFVATFGGSWLFFELVKRVWFLRLFFGMKRK